MKKKGAPAVNLAKTAKAAKGGNLTVDLGEHIDELIDAAAEKKASAGSKGLAGVQDFRSRFGRPGLGRPFGAGRPGFGGSPLSARLGWRPGGYSRMGAMGVTGPINTNELLLGTLVGVPSQQILADGVFPLIGLQNGLLRTALTTAAGIGLHLAGGTSFTLGFGIATTIPLVAQLTDWALRTFGVVKAAPAAAAAQPMAPAPTPMRGVAGANQMAGRSALAALQALQQRISAPAPQMAGYYPQYARVG